MKNILLPETVYIDQIPNFIKRLGAANSHPEIGIDFRCVKFYSMPAIVSLAGKIHTWIKQGKRIKFHNEQGFYARSYFERVNFFALTLGADDEESFKRWPPKNRFVDIKRIENTYTFRAENLSIEIANCIVPEQADEVEAEKTGFHDGVFYFVSELIMNVIQHSRGVGFIGAQYYDMWDETQITIADNGIGLMNSFIENDSPFAHRISSDQDAIELAIQNKVSSKIHRKDPLTGGTVNAGVGLTFLREMTQLTGGSFLIASGDAMLQNNDWHSLGPNLGYAGTMVCLSFKRDMIDNEGYGKLLESCRVKYVG